MDVLTRYAKFDNTKDPTSDDEKSVKGKKNTGKGQQNNRHNSGHGHNGNHGNNARILTEVQILSPTQILASIISVRTSILGDLIMGTDLITMRKPSKPHVPNTVLMAS